MKKTILSLILLNSFSLLNGMNTDAQQELIIRSVDGQIILNSRAHDLLLENSGTVKRTLTALHNCAAATTDNVIHLDITTGNLSTIIDSLHEINTTPTMPQLQNKSIDDLRALLNHAKQLDIPLLIHHCQLILKRKSPENASTNFSSATGTVGGTQRSIRSAHAAALQATAPSDDEAVIRITFSDTPSKEVTLKKKYAECSQTLRDVLNDCADASDNPIPLSITAKDYELLAPYWESVYQILTARDKDQKKERKAQLIAQLKKIAEEKETLGSILNSADYLDIKPLLNCGLQVASHQIITEVNFDNFMDEETLKNYNPYQLTENPNNKLAALLIEPAALFLENQVTLLHTFTGHTFGVTSACFSPDGETVLTSSWDQTAKLWDINTGQCLKTFTGHTRGVNSACFSPDGETMLTASWDHTAKLWDSNTGNCLQTFTGHTRVVTSACFSPDGKTMLTASYDGTAKLWDIHNGDCLKTFAGHTDEVNSACFSPDGETVLTSSDDHTAKLWDINTGDCLQTFTGHTKRVISACFSPDGKTVLTASKDKTAKLWDINTGQCLHTLTGHTEIVIRTCLSPDGETVLTASEDGTAKLWDINTGDCLQTFTGHTSLVISACFSPDGNTVLTAAYDNSAKLWDINTGDCLKTFTGHTDWVRSACFSPNGKTILTASDDGTAKLWRKYPQKKIDLKNNTTLPQALLLRYALKKRTTSDSQEISLECSYPTIYRSFNCWLISFLQPLIGDYNCTQHVACMARSARNAITAQHSSATQEASADQVAPLIRLKDLD